MFNQPTTSKRKTEQNILSLVNSSFEEETISETIKNNITDSKLKVGEDAVKLMTLLMKTLVVEAAVRSAKEAKLKDKNIVCIQNTNKILTSILLDYL